ncbi:adult-specific rigid cuticular protein 15.7 [Caerostris extrusa]|uniref:Adult-specific rigid cuticular protein 15.7 n=1 Tax=Caerostris extrusa TaxID=172846 RepID=A0AAV4TD22_CAEEX|nr:adult-specific rigid cuticular protein 15.7 [Caerostris extrusa]
MWTIFLGLPWVGLSIRFPDMIPFLQAGTSHLQEQLTLVHTSINTAVEHLRNLRLLRCPRSSQASGLWATATWSTLESAPAPNPKMLMATTLSATASRTDWVPPTPRSEVGDAHGNKKGSYTIADIDGRARRVDYVADGHGFRATVKTNEPGTAASAPAAALIASPYAGPVAPVVNHVAPAVAVGHDVASMPPHWPSPPL